MSQHVAPHRFSAVAEAYSDNVDLSVDKFPLNEDEEEPEEPLPTRLERRLSSLRGEMKCPSDIVIHKRYRSCGLLYDSNSLGPRSYSHVTVMKQSWGGNGGKEKGRSGPGQEWDQ